MDHYMLNDNYVISETSLSEISKRIRNYRVEYLNLSLTPTSKEYVTITDTIAIMLVDSIILRTDENQEKILINIGEQIVSLISEEFIVNKDVLLARVTKLLNRRLRILTQTIPILTTSLLSEKSIAITYDIEDVKSVVIDTLKSF